MPRREFDRLPAGEDRFNDIGRKKGQGKNPADLAILNLFLMGKRDHRGFLARQPIQPVVSLSDCFDELWVDFRWLFLSGNDQPGLLGL